MSNIQKSGVAFSKAPPAPPAAANDNLRAARLAELKGTWLSVPAERLNEELRIKGYTQPPFTPGSKAFVVRTHKQEEFARVYVGEKPTGRFIARKADVLGLTPEQLKNKFALPHLPERLVPATLPPRITLYAGQVASQPTWKASGGATQFYLADNDIDPLWFDETKAIELRSGIPVE